MNRYLRTRVKTIHDVKSMVVTKVDAAPKLRARELRLNGGKRNRLKGKRLSSPRWVVHKSIVNMKGMNVNLHRLRPVPINRWIVPTYCSHWLVLARASRLYFHLLSGRMYKCNLMLFLFIHDYIIKDILWCLIIIHVISHFLYASYFIDICCDYEGTSFITFVRRSLYP
jgi:hypothetical protein